MFDLVFAVPGEDEAVRMRFDNIVFVMEDVDAASKVVYRRAPAKDKKKGKGKGKWKGDEGKGKGTPEEGKGKGTEEEGKGQGPKGLKGLPSAPLKLNRAQSHTLTLVRTITIGSEPYLGSPLGDFYLSLYWVEEGFLQESFSENAFGTLLGPFDIPPYRDERG